MLKTYFTVEGIDISSLSSQSHRKVIRQCDHCGKEDTLEYRHYLKARNTRKKLNNIDLCKKCAFPVSICKIDSCTDLVSGRGMCSKHYQREPDQYLNRTKWAEDNYKRRREIALRHAQSPEGRFNLTKRQAKKRNMEFSISKEEFIDLIKNKCHYCGGVTTGLDRKDNNKHYIIDNVVPCCPFCNKLKNELLTEEEMLEVIKFLKIKRNKENIWEGLKYHSKAKYKRKTKYGYE